MALGNNPGNPGNPDSLDHPDNCCCCVRACSDLVFTVNKTSRWTEALEATKTGNQMDNIRVNPLAAAAFAESGMYLSLSLSLSLLLSLSLSLAAVTFEESGI